jgi:hypothetical protein
MIDTCTPTNNISRQPTKNQGDPPLFQCLPNGIREIQMSQKSIDVLETLRSRAKEQSPNVKGVIIRMTYEEICQLAGWGRSSVTSGINELILFGKIVKYPHQGKINGYQLLDE